ncbi:MULTISPECIES: prepilin peptidase [Paraburkholderia]|uniref:A24 family peptidase n=1 Tax=Paraburkholderia TaxID=1822464 RepID=UPI00225284DB|nr:MULTISPECIES: A24 family peptidase [Paraburkholderia]MCX4164437.1 A24 family peptidase [Paraburkholderia megapolitana]MDN7159930.1 A24 family peptidase [Paraburkholderia sp. CHISQ3]MDQ6496977.1 A24 family peptidase [Paraburkholderia megapolitana]
MNVPFSSLLFVAWTAAIALSDCRSRRVSNALVGAGLVAAFASAFLHHNPFGITPMQAAIGMAIGFVALLPFYALGMMGAADVKVFAVLGAWCGMHALLGLWVAASLIAGAHAVWLLIATRTRLASLVRSKALTFELVGKRSTPFVACLAVPAIAWLGLQVIAGGVR